jgi:hypothetical protein
MAIDSYTRLKKLADKKPIEIADLSTCYFCKITGLKEEDKCCPNCSFPQRGTQAEIKSFLWDIEDMKELAKEHEETVKKGKVALYVIASFTFLGALISDLLLHAYIFAFIVDSVVSIGFLGLALWSDKKPLLSMIIGLAVYLILFVMVPILAYPANLINGIVIKLFIIAAFIYGIAGAYNAGKVKKELDQLNSKIKLKEK